MAQSDKHRRIVGDTLEPLNVVLRFNDQQRDLTGLTVKFVMLDAAGNAVVAETASNVTTHPTQAFTASTATNTLQCVEHGVRAGEEIVVATSGTLPVGLVAATRYFAVQVTPNAFGVAATPDGTPINITTTGSGSHTFYVVGSVQYDFQPNDVDTAGDYKAWFRAYSSTESQTWPDDSDGIPIEIRRLG
jgi:antitoxin (DNA-binding transcriptional repressor) of toxin-antitoxin stability system